MSRRLLSCLVCATALLTACNARPAAAVVTPRSSPTATITVSRDLVRLPLVFTPPESPTPGRFAPTPPPHKVPTLPAPVVADGPYPLADWLANRVAIGYCESRNNYADKGNPFYRGYYQMGYREWFDTGGRKGQDPADAAPAEQDARAQLLYEARGFEPWTCARTLGLYP